MTSKTVGPDKNTGHMTIPQHHPTYCVARGQCWAYCWCGWHTDTRINGNQMWAQLQFGAHLVAARLGVKTP